MLVIPGFTPDDKVPDVVARNEWGAGVQSIGSIPLYCVLFGNPGSSAPMVLNQRYPLRLRFDDVVNGQGKPLFDVPDHFRLEQVAMLAQELGAADSEALSPEDLEAFMRFGVIRMGFLNDDAFRREPFGRSARNARDLRVDRRDAEIG